MGRCNHDLWIVENHRSISYLIGLAEKRGEGGLRNDQGATWFSTSDISRLKSQNELDDICPSMRCNLFLRSDLDYLG